METCHVYLSGGMGSLSFEEQSKWRTNIINAIKYGEQGWAKKPVFFNPVDHYNFQDKHQKNEKEVMEYDLYNLRNSDLVIVYFNDERSIGTAMELMLAKEMHIPVIAFGVNDKEIHPWLIECCTRICDNMKDVVSHVIDFYLN